jgi:hypothetical protein
MNEWTNNWLEGIADDIEAKYGSEIRGRIMGDFRNINDDHESVKMWFSGFIAGMNELDDKAFITSVLAVRCPCSHSELEANIRKNYQESGDLHDFVKRLDSDGLFEDSVSLEGNVLIATKKPFSRYGKHNHTEPYSTSCHCNLGSRASKPISAIFCHCCTVGFYGKMFRNALNMDIKVEFRDSVITGGKGCTAAIYLPGKGREE